MAGKTTTERQRVFRQSKLAAGLKEIRNLWCRPDDESRIRDYVARLLKQHKPFLKPSRTKDGA
jgi:hypothetical protein